MIDISVSNLVKEFEVGTKILDGLTFQVDSGERVGLLGPNGSYKLSILKAADGTGRRCLRQTFEYPGQPGTGHFLHTYAGDGDPLPSFAGEPEQVAVEGDIDSLASAVWDALDEANRISLFVRFTDLETRDFQQRIVNKYSGKEPQA